MPFFEEEIEASLEAGGASGGGASMGAPSSAVADSGVSPSSRRGPWESRVTTRNFQGPTDAN